MAHGYESTQEIRKNGRKVAVIGSGPAGLSCAGDLAKKGYDVTVFEAFHVAGGVLQYGIPQFRLPKELVNAEICGLEKMGVKIEKNMVIGKIFSLDELKEAGYEAIFIGSGAGLPSFMRIPGENLNGVYSANEFLTRINLMKAYEFPEFDTPIKPYHTVAVVGGGNVAMDAARCAKRLGAEKVYIIYRRSEEEMPARLEEVHHAKEEGHRVPPAAEPGGDPGRRKGQCHGHPQHQDCSSANRMRPAVAGRCRWKAANMCWMPDAVVIAIGQSPNPLLKHATPDLKIKPWGGIEADEDGLTSLEGVYAGGDAVTGAATVILAMGAGKRAAAAMDAYLQQK